MTIKRAFGIRNGEIKSYKNQAIELIRIADPPIRSSGGSIPLPIRFVVFWGT